MKRARSGRRRGHRRVKRQDMPPLVQFGNPLQRLEREELPAAWFFDDEDGWELDRNGEVRPFDGRDR